MNTSVILENMKNDLIQSATMRKAFIEGVTMQLGNEGKIDLVLGTQKCFFINVPYEDENRNTIHGNARNNLAKQFIESYKLEDLKAEHLRYFEAEEQKEKKHKESFEAMQVLAEQLQPLFCGYGKVDAHCNYNTKIAEIEADIRIKTANQWEGYHDTINVIPCENDMYNIKRLTYNRTQVANKETYQFTLEQLKSFIPELLEQYNQIEAEEQPKIKAIEEENARQRQIDNIACKICNDKKHTYILKSKRSYIGIRQNYKWAAGIGKEGKYQKTDYFKIAKLIKEKGITEIFVLNDDTNTNSIDWNEKQFFDLLEIA